MFGELYRKTQVRLRRFHPLAQNIDKRIPLNWIVNRSMLSATNKYCYFRIPKCGNSTIVRTLAYYDPDLVFDESDEKGETIKKQTKSSLLESRIKNLDKLASDNFCFTFSRCPFSRTLSAYLDKIIAQGDTKKYSAVRRKIQLSSGASEVSFESFISYLENGGLYHDPHWCPQLSLLPLPISKLSYVGRVENLDDGLKFVIDYIFGPGTYRHTATREDGRQNASNKLAEYYTESLLDRVHLLYNNDFTSLGYSKMRAGTVLNA